LIPEDKTIGDFIQAFEDLQIKYMQNVRSIEKYNDEIVRRIYYPHGLTKKDSIVREDMYLFEQAYSLVKLVFKDKKREDQRRYFEHLKGTMEITLRELPNPNLNKLIIALLHDIVEDIPGYENVIREIYGDYIANGVEVLSKKEWESYLTTEEAEEYAITEDNKRKKELKEIGTERRNEDYFGHLDQLNDDYLDIKIADRLHNLRDMKHLTIKKIEKKLEETKKYFLHVAEKRNPTAYALLMTEVKNLENLLQEKKNE
jgi:(p)ppGpp synthase/HD superfamily hydrolase